MTKQIFINEDGYNSYLFECGCSGVEIPNHGWINMLCDTHDTNCLSNHKSISNKKTKMRYNREI